MQTRHSLPIVNFSARIGRGEDSRRPDEWQLADGYHDHWHDLEIIWIFYINVLL